MLGSEVGRGLAAKLRSTAWRHTQKQLASKGNAEAVTSLVQATAERATLLTWMADPALKYSENGSGDSQRQAVGLLIRTGVDQEIIPLRRGEDSWPVECEILVSMDSSSTGSEAKAGHTTSVSSEGISAFIARVLDQLTLSAWLPAALFTAAAAVLLQFRRQRSVNVLHAVGVLAADPVRVLVLMICFLSWRR